MNCGYEIKLKKDYNRLFEFALNGNRNERF